MTNPLRTLLLGFVCVLWAGSQAAARDIFVNNVVGDDQFDGDVARNIGNNRGPLRTISRALEIARSGDRIVVADEGEPYRESLSLYGSKHSGLEGLPLVIEGNGAILDGTVPIPERAWSHAYNDLFRFRPRSVTYLQLYSDGVPVPRVPVNRYSLQMPEIEPGQWLAFQGEVYFRVHPGRLPHDYQLTFTGLQTGITLYAVRDVVIAGLIVQGFRLDGVNAADLVGDAVLTGITARGNGRSGVSVGGASRVRLQNSLVGDNGEAQIRTEGYCRLELLRTEIVDNTAPAWQMRGGRLIIDGEPVAGDQLP